LTFFDRSYCFDAAEPRRSPACGGKRQSRSRAGNNSPGVQEKEQVFSV
jgi:hypothetical protein